MTKKDEKPGIWVGRSVSGILLWIFDSDFSHPDKSKVFGFALNSGEMREYNLTIVASNIREFTGEGRDAAISAYLRWKEAHGNAFRERYQKINIDALRRERESPTTREGKINSLISTIQKSQSRDASTLFDAIELRQIPYLVHFTRLENLAGILERGILPVSMLGNDIVRNDEIRLDRYPEASSLSISFPNYQMLYRYRCLAPEANWAIVLLSVEVLINIPCLFFPSNAANGKFRNLDNNALDGMMGTAGFNDIFEDSPSGCREDRGLPDRFTTDPQAEVLAFKPVPPTLVGGVRILRHDTEAIETVSRLIPHATIQVGGKLFEPRMDWKHWQSCVKTVESDGEFLDSIPF